MSDTPNIPPHCLWSGRSDTGLEPFEATVTDPFGLRKETLRTHVNPAYKAKVERFVASYNQRARWASCFLVLWFLAQNTLFLAALVEKVTRAQGILLFSAMLVALGTAYALLPYVVFELYSTYGIRRGVRMVRIVAIGLILLGIGLSFAR